MSRLQRMHLVVLVMVLFGIESGEVRADDDPADTQPSQARHDYSRFSDGPRNVPAPRGASQARAQRLGLGTREAATRLLNARPRAAWVEAARANGASMPEHLRWPVDLGRFGRGFGYVRLRRPNLRHNGVDIVADEGSVIRAVAPGIVAYADNGVRGYGNSIAIVHPNGDVSFYAHCVRVTVQPGWHVREGERIGFVGNTGISRGPHLHFEYHVGGRAVSPLSRFEGRPWIAAYRRWRRLTQSGNYRMPTDHLAARLPPDREGHAEQGTRSERASRESQPAQETLIGEDEEGLEEARRLLSDGATGADLELVEGEHFRNALWPVRGGSRGRGYEQPRGVNISSERGAAVRAVADGLVIYSGRGLRGVGNAVVILHKNGWVSLYGSNDTLHVEAGQQVERGEWIARVGDSAGGAPHLHFQLRQGGRSLDVDELFVGAPD